VFFVYGMGKFFCCGYYYVEYSVIIAVMGIINFGVCSVLVSNVLSEDLG